LDEDIDIPEMAKMLALKVDTLRKAVAAGKLHKPSKKSVTRPDNHVNPYD